MPEHAPGKRARPLWERSDLRRLAARRLRRRLALRAAPIIALLAALGLTMVSSPKPRLVWNASASAPIGLYAVAPGASPRRGDMVVAWPPAALRALAARRRYLPRGVPLVKRVAGVSGDTICARGATIAVNGWQVARRRTADALGRSLPRWHGCFMLGSGALFLLMEANPNSFDGRYFGASEASDVIGTARALWLP